MSDVPEPYPAALAPAPPHADDAWFAGESLRLVSVEQLALIRVLAVAHEHRLDVAAAVRELAEESPPSRRQPLRQLAGYLLNGMPLIDALEQTHGVLDRSTVVALRLASETGTLPTMYRAIIRSSEPPTAAAPAGLASPGRHLMAVAFGMLLLTAVLAFQATSIWPTYQQMAEELGPTDVEVMPSTLQFLIRHAHWWPLLTLVGLASIILLIVVQLASGRLNPWRPWAPSAEPFAERGMRRGALDLRALLLIVLGSGRPLASGLATLARFHHVSRTRRRLSAVCQAIERGEDPWGALAEERLLQPRESRALAAASSDTSRTWLLGWLASARRDRRLSRAHVFEQVFTLGLIFVFGAAVAVVATATFQMLSNLIQVLA